MKEKKERTKTKRTLPTTTANNSKSNNNAYACDDNDDVDSLSPTNLRHEILLAPLLISVHSTL